MKAEKKKCSICRHIAFGEVDQKTGVEADSVCKLFNLVLSKEDFIEVDCDSFDRRPHTCASCGADITKSCKKASNPLTYHHGPRKGQTKQCCSNPDWRCCPGRDCEGEAIICRNCGHYYGMETW